jgi:hypothetical protein
MKTNKQIFRSANKTLESADQTSLCNCSGALDFISMFTNKVILMLLSFIMFIILSVMTYAAEVSLDASVVPEKGTVGQPLTYTITISGIDPVSLKITLPEKKVVYPDKKIDEKNRKKDSAGDEKFSEEFVPLYIINNALRDESEVNGVKQVNIKIQLSYYRTGTYLLPEVKIAGIDGIAIGYKIPEVVIEELNKEGTLEDIEPPVSLSGNYTRVIWIILVLLLAAAAVVLLYRYIKKRRKTILPDAPSLPPIEIFLNEVESLKLRELISEGRINEYVFDISIIFRRYLSAMLKFDAAEMTTDEIAKRIKKYMPSDLYAAFGDEIISNMCLWDFSKFAEFTPSAELLLNNLDATISAAKRISGTDVNAENATAREGENGTVRI